MITLKGLAGRIAAKYDRTWNLYVRARNVLASAARRVVPSIQDIVRARLHPSSDQLLRFYEEDWQGALQAKTNALPERLLLDERGTPLPIGCVASIFFIPNGKVKNELFMAFSHLSDLLPERSIWTQPFDTYHIAVCHSTGILPADRSAAKERQAGRNRIHHLETIVPTYPPSRFHIVGITLNRIGVLFAKVVAEDDHVLRIRRAFQESDPKTPRQKEVYNLTLGRIYRPLIPTVWSRLREEVEQKYLDRYFGSMTLDTIVAIEEIRAYAHEFRHLFEVRMQGKK